MSALTPDTQGETIYVKDGPAELTEYMLERLAKPVVSAPDGAAEAVITLLTRAFGARPKAVADVQVDVAVDGESFLPSATLPLLRAEVRWLDAFVIVLLPA
jgi:hypothetical protein